MPRSVLREYAGDVLRLVVYSAGTILALGAFGAVGFFALTLARVIFAYAFLALAIAAPVFAYVGRRRERRAWWLGAYVVLWVATLAAFLVVDGLTLRDQVAAGPDERADLIVCLQKDLTDEELGEFEDWFFSGGVPRTPISMFLNNASIPALALAWGEGADEEGRLAFIQALEADCRVLRVVEDTSMVEACSSHLDREAPATSGRTVSVGPHLLSGRVTT